MKKYMHWIAPLSVLILPFITLHIHKAYKIVLEANYKIVWSNVWYANQDGIGTAFGLVAACLMFMAVMWHIVIKTNGFMESYWKKKEGK